MRISKKVDVSDVISPVELRNEETVKTKYLQEFTDCKITYTVELISPQIAKEYLDRNVNFRELDEDAAKLLAEEIKRGSFQINGENIKFDIDGNLVDGQTRLFAIILAGISIPVSVVRNVPKEPVVDLGKKRRVSQYIAKDKEDNPTVITAAVNLLIRYFTKEGKIGGGRRSYSISQVRAFIEKFPDIRLSVKFCSRKGVRKIMSPSAASACHFILKRMSQTRCEAFFNSLITGENLLSGDPILVLRDTLLKKNSFMKVDSKAVISMVIKTWNASVSSSKISSNKLKADFDIPKPIMINNKEVK